MTNENLYEERPLKVSGLKLAALSFSTLGIIYSDIGTSPLYVLNGIWPSGGDVPPEEDVIGGISAIVWSLTLLPLLKYVFFALEFGTTKGEGGPFALYMSLFPRKEPTDDRSLTTYTTDNGDTVLLDQSNRLSKIRMLKWPMFCWALFGTALTLADGVMTPPISVSTAVAGIAVAQPSVSNSLVGISCAFLIVLFLIQRLGTQKIGFIFAPVTCIWLLLLGATGIYNITYHPGIFRAFDPSRAILWFVRTKDYDQLNGVLLAITGCEAMFANLSHFNKTSIRIAFAGFVYPMLVLQYLGQGAKLIDDSSVLSNMFYMCIPGPNGGALYWIVFVFAILAALIASQAMITGCFALIQQLIGMHAFPTLRILHTSTLTSGQIYIPVANWLLLIGCIGVAAGFGSSTAINYAYGFAVATVTFVTTTLISLCIPFVKGLPFILGISFFIFFGFLDGIFWGAALRKVPHGAWVTLTVGICLYIIMVFWTWGRHLEDRFEDNNNVQLSRLIGRNRGKRPEVISIEPTDLKVPLSSEGGFTEIDETPVLKNQEDDPEEGDHLSALVLHTLSGDDLELERIPVFAVFHKNDSAGRGVPHSFVSFLRSYPALPVVVVFLTTRIVAVPHVPIEDTYIVNKVRYVDGFYSVTMRVGYLDHSSPGTAYLTSRLIEIERRFAQTGAEADALVHKIETAAKNVTHVIPNYTLVSKRAAGWRLWAPLRRVLVEDMFARARTIFPDRQNSPEDQQSSTLHVGVSALV